MAVRRGILSARSGGYKGRKYKDQRTHPLRESDKTTMLNLRKISAFRYEIKEIMSHYKIEESAAKSVMASVIAKGSRISVDSARTYVLEQEKTGAYPKEALMEICNLLDRFSTLR